MADNDTFDSIENDPESEDQELSFLQHLVELRSRLLKCCVAVLAALVVLMPFSRKLYHLLAEPLIAKMPAGSGMIAIDVASPFLTPFKLTMLVAVLVAIPVILYQLWAFVAPALFKHEKRLARPLLVSSIILFYTGFAFAYFVVFPLMFDFLTKFAPEGVSMMTDISRYLDFVMTLFMAFGIAFEVPIATIILVATGITTADKLASYRAYVIVGAFALGMVLTPPDVISQTLLALPMWVLFEVGIIFSRILLPEKASRKKRGEQNDDETDQATS